MASHREEERVRSGEVLRDGRQATEQGWNEGRSKVVADGAERGRRRGLG